jgi:hypothetical protein
VEIKDSNSSSDDIDDGISKGNGNRKYDKALNDLNYSGGND